ncbi:Peptidase_M78 domain-containing protein [Vibrio chagasii]|nr:Peptidase_M78 domain-containing protein [Vibrio chagasii]CAH7305911.1 Peptidase_M78 domain-containing protein [Vibrio chagasii]
MTVNLQQFEKVTPDKLLQDLGLYAVPVNVEEVCRRLDVELSKKVSLSSMNYSGEISSDSNGISIWVNPLDSDNRRRFTIAHELGHLVHDIIPELGNDNSIKYSDTQKTLKRDGRQAPEEYRANDFAAKLLMPEKLILERSKVVIKNIQGITKQAKVPRSAFIEGMAKMFSVSEQAMEIRLKNVNILK